MKKYEYKKEITKRQINQALHFCTLLINKRIKGDATIASLKFQRINNSPYLFVKSNNSMLIMTFHFFKYGKINIKSTIDCYDKYYTDLLYNEYEKTTKKPLSYKMYEYFKDDEKESIHWFPFNDENNKYYNSKIESKIIFYLRKEIFRILMAQVVNGQKTKRFYVEFYDSGKIKLHIKTKRNNYFRIYINNSENIKIEQTIKDDKGKYSTIVIENKFFEKNYFLDNNNKIRRYVLEKESRLFINKIF